MERCLLVIRLAHRLRQHAQQAQQAWHATRAAGAWLQRRGQVRTLACGAAPRTGARLRGPERGLRLCSACCSRPNGHRSGRPCRQTLQAGRQAGSRPRTRPKKDVHCGRSGGHLDATMASARAYWRRYRAPCGPGQGVRSGEPGAVSRGAAEGCGPQAWRAPRARGGSLPPGGAQRGGRQGAAGGPQAPRRLGARAGPLQRSRPQPAEGRRACRRRGPAIWRIWPGPAAARCWQRAAPGLPALCRI